MRTFIRLSRSAIVSAGLCIGILGVVSVEHRSYEAARPTAIQATDTSDDAMRPAPIRKDWIIAGTPTTEYREVGQTHDGSTSVYIWRTTASTFRWQFDADEIVTILDGEVSIAEADGRTRQLKSGDVALFPMGSTSTWTVPDHVTKSAVVKRAMPKPVETAVRWLRTARDLVGPEKAFAK